MLVYANRDMSTVRLNPPTGSGDSTPALSDLFASARHSRTAAQHSAVALFDASPILIRAIRGRSGQGERVAAIARSVWNGCHQVGLCDALAGLDYPVAKAVIALIAARAHMGGDADELIRVILEESGEMERMLAE